VRNQFTRQADAYAETEQARDEKAMAGLAKLSGVGAQDEVLDVACGPGRLTAAFARLCKQAVGCDATDALLAIARREAANQRLTNLRFDAGDAYALPYDNDTFSLVTCRAAFHHFTDPGAALAEMARVARPGGRLLVADLLGCEDLAKADRHDAIERLCDPTHARAIPVSEFRRMIADQGLVEVSFLSAEMSYDVEEWLDHGGPSFEAAEEIRGRLKESAASDTTGLKVREEDGVLRFSHQTGVFILAK
jgi:ubiquinone/menaquinone biosynthesis C-methylase UbiE